MRTPMALAWLWTAAVVTMASMDAISGMKAVHSNDHHFQVASWTAIWFVTALGSMAILGFSERDAEPAWAFTGRVLFVSGLFLSVYNLVWQVWEIALGRFSFPVRLYPFVFLKANAIGWYEMILMGTLLSALGYLIDCHDLRFQFTQRTD